MKNRLLAGFSVFALMLGALFVNGCKDSVSDPGYVPLASIRFANFHQVDPIQIYMYPTGTTPDTIAKTPTGLTYGIVTPYFTNLATNRTAGLSYHLVARLAGTQNIVASTDVILKPGDKKTWLISGDGFYKTGTTKVDATIINDVPPSVPTSLGYFRFLNVTPDQPTPLNLIVGDPLNGKVIATGVPYDSVSSYVGLPTARDTSITLYVTDMSGNVLGRLAGIGIDSGSFQTVTWGGQDPNHRAVDPTTGQHIPDDSVRIRILDDNDVGHDVTVPVPQTFRFNLINALIPPNYPSSSALLLDYAASGGLNIIINNNTAYDYTGVMPFSDAPPSFSPSSTPATGDPFPVLNVIPTAISLTDAIYIKMVKPPVGGLVPSVADSIVCRFFASRNIIKSDLLYTIVVFDSVQKLNPNLAEPYDSSGSVTTVLIPDIPSKDSAIIVLGNMLAPPYRLNGKGQLATTNKGVFTVNGTIASKVQNTKSTQNIFVLADGSEVTLQAVINSAAPETFTYKFTPEKGGIYEAFLVGEREHVNSAYQPRFIVVRTNPKTP